jgi:hypothetical protein
MVVNFGLQHEGNGWVHIYNILWEQVRSRFDAWMDGG